MQINLYATESALMSRWQAALHSDARCCASLADAMEREPGSVLLVHWSGLDKSQQQQVLQDAGSGPRVVLVDHPTLEEGEWLISRGIEGYANTYIQPDLLPQVVKAVLKGDIWTGPELMQGLLKRLLARQGPVTDPVAEWNLSAREQQVLEQLVQGHSNKQIARELEITERTVKAHVSAILEKSGVRDRIELILILSGQVPSEINKQEQGYEI
ncbi:response regulator transcription factor [Marinobacterium sediminicola]|uniref:DNA-binding response regulator, NarL/FixJ family, contains REC and HTH domains n=1 Tax=Marinobacterium sediminicola TaxID=518898 RepID=A0ABY1RXX0_9GAMM|nr:response regulator transcription factor [Marinobacterium sediminicola]ULG68590.1 response regulator transcription factor [Marinobacterium sediminicola]SMR73108.1 DNA-binding response regulator, NarL/FixJ family, contains REC and HTH domains [Marinobacterium sediminicola]